MKGEGEGQVMQGLKGSGEDLPHPEGNREPWRALDTDTMCCAT